MSNIMSEEKQKKVDTFKQWLIDGDYQFIEKPNGLFQIYNTKGEIAYQVWATTQKMVDADSRKYIGDACILNTLSAFHGNECCKVMASPIQANNAGAALAKSELRKRFEDAYESNKDHMYDCILVMAVYLPTGATEIITNHYEVQSKMEYYLKAYDNAFCLKTNPKVAITGFMLV